MGRVESTNVRSWVGIGLIAATGVIHLVETPEYMGEMPYIGILFALSVVGALLAAFGIYRGKRWGWVLGVAVAGGSLFGYLLSRTVGLPLFRENTWEEFAEPVGLLSVLVEGLFLGVAANVLSDRATSNEPGVLLDGGIRASSFLVAVIAVTAIGFGVIIDSAAAPGTLAQEATPPPSVASSAPTDVAVTLAADGTIPARTALLAGQPYRFVVTNTDVSPHQFLLTPADASTPLAAGDKKAEADGIAPSQTKSFDWTFAEPGDFQMADDRGLSSQPALAAAFTVVPANTPTLTVQLGDFSVTPGTAKLQAGRMYLFEVTNTGAATHEFVLESASSVDEPLSKVADGAKMEAEAEDIAPGQTKDVLWAFATPGDYQMACHVPGHFEAGMKADFTVVP